MKRYLAIILTAILVVISLIGCSAIEVLRINVPDEIIEAELGGYELPKYRVVNQDNLIKANYEVIVKKVVDPNGNEVKVAYNRINVTEPGIYTVTYGEVNGKVDDAILKIDFADRTAPGLKMETGALPDYYIQGMEYSLPSYSLTGNPDIDASWLKVFYAADRGGDRSEVTITDNRFLVEYNIGFYFIVIHAEDSTGNVKEYEFAVTATGPSEIVEGKIIYSDELFGASQFKLHWSTWTVSYSTEKAWKDEAGSVKVTAPSGGTDYLIFSKLIQKDVSEYDYLVVRIYNDNDYPVWTGCTWFGDSILLPNEWTEIRYDLETLNEKGSHPAIGALKPSSSDLTNLGIRFWDASGNNVITAGSKFYISNIYAVKQNTSGPEEVKDDVIGYFDEEWGTMQGEFFWGVNRQNFDSNIAYEGESGSLKITALTNNQPYNYYILKNPAIADVSKYDFIEFNVYNPTGHDFKIQLTWAGDTICKAGEWTNVKFPISLFDNGKITNMNSDVMSASNITNLPICFWTEEFTLGEAFYISQIKGGYYPQPEDIDDNIAMKFDSDVDFSNVTVYWPAHHNVSIDTTVKYGDEAGSLKLSALGNQNNYIILSNPYNTDFSAYDYISFWVYNAGGSNVKLGTTWAADTVCKPGEWTEVKIDAGLFGENGKITDMSSNKISLDDITNLPIRIFATDNVAVNDCIYISSVQGHNYPQPEGIDENIAMKFDSDVDFSNVTVYWPAHHNVSIDTTVKYGDEAGSLKLSALGNQNNYIILSNPYNTDFSAYSYISFWVYNASSSDIKVGTTWAADTVCKPGEWTEVIIDASLFGDNGKITDMSSNKISLDDITNLPIRIFATENIKVNDCIYISSVKGYK